MTTGTKVIAFSLPEVHDSGWVVLATGALPFVNDPVALGRAISTHPHLLYLEMVSILQERPTDLIVLAAVSGVFVLSVAALATLGFRANGRLARQQGVVH